jgi:GTP cyclohydrolase I
VYPVLKRPDEKYVTEKAYNNPKFVEDIAREVGMVLQKTNIFKWYKVKVKNKESIHTHDAIAYIERSLKGRRWRAAQKSLRKQGH